MRKLFSRKDFIGVITTRAVTDDFNLTKDLGEGSFAQVKLAVNKKTGVNEVVKRIPIDDGDTELLQMINNEIQILMECVRIYLFC